MPDQTETLESIYRLARNALRKRGKIPDLESEITRLRNGIFRYVEAHHKKMAGSTIQYSIKWLEDLLEEPDA